MQELRFVGVHEDGLHLLFADGEGNRFRAPLDEAVRSAARREHSAWGSAGNEAGAGLRPRDVQAMIRGGLSAEEVAERAGWPVEKVHRYEGPILAEREHVAGLARQVRLRPRAGSHGAASTLEARVTERMRSREIEPDTASWDSFRGPTGQWSVIVLFSAGGRRRQAGWDFDPLARTVSATDDEARWLSEDDDVETPGPIPAPHLQAPTRPSPPSAVYDVEAEGGVAAPPSRRRPEPVDLMAAMRERSSQRGRRRRSASSGDEAASAPASPPSASTPPGLDRAPDEALPIEQLAMRTEDAGLPPPAHTHPDDDPTATPVKDAPRRARSKTADEPAAPVVDEPLPISDLTDLTDLTDLPDQGAGPADEGDHATTAEAGPDTDRESDPVKSAASSPRRTGRPSVPSWDDIMFGRKSD